MRWVLPFLLVLLVLAACGDGDANDLEPTASELTATAVGGTPTVDTRTAASERGQEPVFWRTTDQFASLRAGEGYKVIFRVTNGYAEDTLSIVAEPEGGEALEIVASRVQPGEGEGPGAFYAVNIDLPQHGRWQLTVMAGEDEVVIPVEAGPSATPVSLP